MLLISTGLIDDQVQEAFFWRQSMAYFQIIGGK